MEQDPVFVAKHPDEVIVRTLEWAAHMAAVGASAITAVAWVADSGLTVADAGNDADTTSVRLSGGTAGETYRVECTVTFDGGPDKATFVLTVVLRDEVA